MKQGNNKTTESGFTLMEALIAIAVIVFGVVGAVALVNFALSTVEVSRTRVVATGLLQEGMEVVRTMRDDNWHAGGGTSWDRHIRGCGNDRTYTVDAVRLHNGNNPRSCSADAIGTAVLYRTSDGHFTHQQGGNAETPYRRLVTVSDVGNSDGVEVEVLVQWTTRGRTHQLQAIDRLWNWK